MKKNPVEKLREAQKMELKTHTPLDPKFVFEKIKFEDLRYIQHCFMRQRLELSKDQTRMFKSLI